jgi:hypothetical protein
MGERRRLRAEIAISGGKISFCSGEPQTQMQHSLCGKQGGVLINSTAGNSFSQQKQFSQ